MRTTGLLIAVLLLSTAFTANAGDGPTERAAFRSKVYGACIDSLPVTPARDEMRRNSYCGCAANKLVGSLSVDEMESLEARTPAAGLEERVDSIMHGCAVAHAAPKAAAL